MKIEDEISGELEADWKLSRLNPKIQAAVQRAIVRCGMVARLESVRNAPRSPTMAQISATLKRKRRTARRTHPGGLEKSIMLETTATEARVFVPVNSYAGKYAKRIHDEKGVTWRNRGPGTIAKGPQADEKFIERAIRAHEESGNFNGIFEDEIGKVVDKL